MYPHPQGHSIEIRIYRWGLIYSGPLVLSPDREERAYKQRGRGGGGGGGITRILWLYRDQCIVLQLVVTCAW